MNGGLKPPYRILLDGTFLVACIRQKLSSTIQDRLKRILQGEQLSLYTTRSVLDELESLQQQQEERQKGGTGSETDHFIFNQARQLGLDECEILETSSIPKISNGSKNKKNGKTIKTNSTKEKEEVDDSHLITKLGKAGSDIYKLAITKSQQQQHEQNPHSSTKQYFIATQDDTLCNELRRVQCTPLIRISRAVLILESPSEAIKKMASHAENNKLKSAGGTMTYEEREYVNKVKILDQKARKRKREEETIQKIRMENNVLGSEPGHGNGGIGSVLGTIGRKKKKAKEPNPLSCKKRAIHLNKNTSQTDGKKKRRRNKK